MIGGIQAGSFSFTVGAGASSGSSSIVGGGSNSPAAGGSISDLFSGIDLSSVPSWAWIAAAGLGLLLVVKR